MGSSAHGTKDAAGEVAVAVVPPAVADIAAGSSNPGAGRRNYSGKVTSTLSALAIGRRVTSRQSPRLYLCWTSQAKFDVLSR